MPKVLVTGGTGFLGSYLIRSLVDRGDHVRAIRRPNSKMHLLGGYEDKVEWVDGNVLDIFSLETALNDIEYVYHSAAMISFIPKERDMMMKINVEGTANMVNIARESGVKKFLHVSSISAFGRCKIDEIIHEETEWHDGKKNTNYAISKFLAEREVWRAQAEGLNTVIVNPSTILGAGDWNIGSGKIFSKMWNGLKFYTRGTNGFVDVRDVVAIIIQLMHSDLHNNRYILSSENWSFKDLFALIAREFDLKPPAIEAGPFLGALAWRMDTLKGMISGTDPLITKETAQMASMKFRYKNDKIRRALNVHFRPLEETIIDTCRAFKNSIEAGEHYAVYSS